jgi:hypothetical protein
MKSIILLLAIIGIIIIASGYIQNNLQCPPPIVQYRYIQKTFDQEQETQKPLLSIAGINNMFENDSPWVQANSMTGFNVHTKS